MEHQKVWFLGRKSSQPGWISTFILAVLLLNGCDKPNPNPETLDPIYADFLKQSEEAQKEHDTLKAEISKLSSDIDKLEPRDQFKGQMTMQKYKKEKTLVGLEQRILFFKLKAAHRMELDQKNYFEAYKSKKAWPNPQEFVDYKAVKKLQSDSRNWDDRVPKTTRYGKNPEVEKKADGKSEEKKKPASE